MDSSYPNVSSFWDMTQPSNFAQLPDDDFMAMLQKQFPFPPPQPDRTQNFHSLPATGLPDGVNPQNISRFSFPSLTPPSDDSSPSPPHNADSTYEPNGEDSGGGGEGGSRSASAGPKSSAAESALKRKVSGVDISEDGPSQKSQHTLSNDKKGATSSSVGSRRKSTGGVAKDETRLLKRKEQNRAAQRAFRERKEKHVKDLEDKVAELEAKNDAAQHENENLRDLLSRLQSENVMLKQSNFTFTMSPKSQSDPATSVPRHFSPEGSIYNASPPTSVISPESSHIAPKPTNLLDWTSLTSFDPSVLNLLDETPQPTATSSAMNLDLFSGSNPESASGSPFTMIASNPMFMSFASSFDTISSPPDNSSNLGNGNGGRSNGQSFNFDMNTLASWPTPTPPTQDTSLDDLFAGYLNPNQNIDFSSTFATPSISPVAHQATINNNFANPNNNSSFVSLLSKPSPDTGRTSSVPSPSSQSTASSEPPLNTPKESHSLSISATPESDHSTGINNASTNISYHDKSQCPKTKTELVQRIAEAGASPFAPLGLAKSSDQHGSVVSCAGSKFPKTTKNDKNVEVLSAWRSITSNPVFKEANIDINDLCSQFTSKAKCDGTKVVLEPEGMHDIIESLSAKKQ